MTGDNFKPGYLYEYNGEKCFCKIIAGDPFLYPLSSQIDIGNGCGMPHQVKEEDLKHISNEMKPVIQP